MATASEVKKKFCAATVGWPGGSETCRNGLGDLLGELKDLSSGECLIIQLLAKGVHPDRWVGLCALGYEVDERELPRHDYKDVDYR